MTENKQFLFIEPKQLAVGIITQTREIMIELQFPHEDTGLMSETELAIRMTPAEARKLCLLINKKADEAEAGLPRC